MPASRTTTPARPSDLAPHLGASGEKEYRRLVRAVRMGYGSFFLFPIESDLSNARRAVFLSRLSEDLAAEGLTLRVASLTRDCWNVFDTPALETPVTASDVVVLVGLEETPGIVPEAGAPPTRPPALALLNSARETLHRQVPAPMLVWCPPFAYTALMEHAPDFFDHYTGLFQFPDAAPEARPTERITFSDTRQPERPSQPERGVGSRAAIEFYERQVAEHPAPTPERARVLNGLAEALEGWQGSAYTTRLERARVVVEEALSLLSPETNAYEWGRGQNILGNILFSLPTGNQNDNIHRAIGCYQAALTIYDKEHFSDEWVTLQNNLGNVYTKLPPDKTGNNLRHAISHFKAALEVCTREAFPNVWATTQNNLGTAYYLLPTSDHVKNLRRAIKCFEAALTVHRETTSPEDWAVTQGNLGITYGTLITNNLEDNIRRAVACFEAALRVYTKEAHPKNWAWTQENLGTAYLQMFNGDRSENLRHATDYFEAALTVYTEVDFPGDWARTQSFLACTLQDQGDLVGAEQAFQKALRGYRTVGDEQKTQKIEEVLRLLSEEK